MSDTLKALIGCLLLVMLGSAALDWQDTAERLRQESQTSAKLRQRLESQAPTVDWPTLAQQAQQAQNAWLDRLVEVETTGVFRAVAMERMADLCKSLDIPCQVGAEGEKVLTTAQEKSNSDKASPKTLPGIVSATVRVSLPVSSPKLHQLINDIEAGHDMRSIEKFTVRAGRVEIRVQHFGMLKTAMRQLRPVGTATDGGQP